MARHHKISFITATFHQPHRLRRAVECLREQTNPHWEMVISPDDGNDYGSMAKIDARVRVLSTTEKDTGTGPARNRGRAIATGDYIAVLDDDDMVPNNFVAEVPAGLKSHQAVTVPTSYAGRTDSLYVKWVPGTPISIFLVFPLD